MNREELRNEFTRLRLTETLKDGSDMLDIYASYFFKVMSEHQDILKRSGTDKDAALLNQMMFSKSLHVRKLIDNNGVSFKSDDGKGLNPIIDPTIVVSLVRNIYETVS